MQTIFTILGTIVVLLLVAGVAIMIRSRFSSPNGADDREDDRQLHDRLEHPKFDELEQQFVSTMPGELRWLYRQGHLVAKRNIRIMSELQAEHEYEIDHFLPADARTLKELWFDIGARRFPFAVDGFGNYFFIELHDRQGQPTTVFYIDHDGGDVRPIAQSLKSWFSSVHLS